MNRLHRWMIEKFLPRYAHELLLDELAATDKRLGRRPADHCRAERREPGAAVCPAADRARVPHGTGGRAAA